MYSRGLFDGVEAVRCCARSCDVGTTDVRMLVYVGSLMLCGFALTGATEGGVHQRVQRDVEGLIPFPRVGRRDTSLIDPRGRPTLASLRVHLNALLCSDFFTHPPFLQ